MRTLLKSLPLIIGLLSLAGEAQALTIPINCGKQQVGNIIVNISTAAERGVGVTGGFVLNTPTFPNMNAAAAQCGEDHFNWYQVVTMDNDLPFDIDGNRLPTPPYVDPPPGGYGNDPNTPENDTMRHDSLPWYWNEGAPPAGDPAFAVGFHLTDAVQPNNGLVFEDIPRGIDGTSITFKTYLVSLNADSSLHEFHEGFTWTYKDPLGTVEPFTAFGILASGDPTRAEYQDIIGGFATHIPEPGSLVLVGIGLVALVSRKRLQLNAGQQGTTVL